MNDQAKCIQEHLSALAVELESTADAVCHAAMTEETFELACQGIKIIRCEIEALKDVLLMGGTASAETEYRLY